MQKVLVFSTNLKIKPGDERTVLYAGTKNELAHLLVKEKNADCLIMDYNELSDEDITFIKSVRLNFPIITTGVIAPLLKEKIVTGSQDTKNIKFLSREKEGFEEDFENFIETSKGMNKRESNRFCWPLTAEYSSNESGEHSLEIFSISSGGAYLKSTNLLPRAGEKGRIKICFKNSEIETGCTVNDHHARSSNFPFGFSVRFTSLSEKAEDALNRLVDDAVIRILIDPLTEPEIPSLDMDELSIDTFTL